MSSPPNAQTLPGRPRAQLPGRGWLLALGLALLAGAVAAVLALSSGEGAAAHRASRPPPRAPGRSRHPTRSRARASPTPPARATHARAAAPSVAAAAASPGAPSLAQVERQLAQERQLQKARAEPRRGPGYVDPLTGAFTPAQRRAAARSAR